MTRKQAEARVVRAERKLIWHVRRWYNTDWLGNPAERGMARAYAKLIAAQRAAALARKEKK